MIVLFACLKFYSIDLLLNPGKLYVTIHYKILRNVIGVNNGYSRKKGFN